MNLWKNKRWIVGLLFCLLVAFWAARTVVNSSPISVGFVGQLTGKQSELGIQSRDGVLLAVETINATGGIKGHPLNLIIRDDQGEAEKAREVDRELIASEVVAIIGHPTSAQSQVGMEITNPAKMVLISPTVSSPAFSGQDDYFFRVYPSFRESAQAFAEYVFLKEHISDVAVILDGDNAGYSQTYGDTFQTRFKSLGGKVTGLVHFSSKKQLDPTMMLARLQAENPTGILIVASDIDTALIAQRLRLMNWRVPLFTSAWAQTETLISNGGRAVEGLKLEQSFDMSSQSSNFLDFRKRFENRFGRSPSFGAAFGYEATMVLAHALEKTDGKKEGLKDALLTMKNFPGLIDNFSLDRFGDVERPFYLSEIQNGKFIFLEKLTVQPTGTQAP